MLFRSSSQRILSKAFHSRWYPIKMQSVSASTEASGLDFDNTIIITKGCVNVRHYIGNDFGISLYCRGLKLFKKKVITIACIYDWLLREADALDFNTHLRWRTLLSLRKISECFFSHEHLIFCFILIP